MKKIKARKQQLRLRRKQRVRSAMQGTQVKPRLCVVKTNMHIYAHLIDDENGKTIGTASTVSKDFKKELKRNRASAKIIGEKIADIAKQNDIKEAIFDRGWASYRGVLAELANAARGAGLKF